MALEFAIALHCVCGSSYFSDREGRFHTCPACSHVYDLRPDLAKHVALARTKPRGAAHAPRKDRDRGPR